MSDTKKIRRAVVERFKHRLEPMVRLECGHTTHERGRWVDGKIVLNKTVRCWDCETIEQYGLAHAPVRTAQAQAAKSTDVADLEPEHAAPAMEPSVLIERTEDMCNGGRLTLCRDSDGAMHLRVIPPAGRADEYAPSIAFTAKPASSPRTFAALEALLVAMRLDNE
ncbi:hypothetical protein [Pseudomonas sp.]|uniref:hypothetical protein n=1 Tax=Pseudomonas sp. TaxID=306 RepID=UPI002914CB6C|nr:hypothetical protein [Pseudomonas sp.]MDU4254505.1 hypothetical protein [Pseudomonas sp.]